MKKLLFILFLMICLPVVAVEPQQIQKAEDVKGAIVIKKQPTQENAKQVQEISKVYGSIIILVQGKTPFDKTDSQK